MLSLSVHAKIAARKKQKSTFSYIKYLIYVFFYPSVSKYLLLNKNEANFINGMPLFCFIYILLFSFLFF